MTGACRNRRRSSRGFTLVELTVVVVILGILATFISQQYLAIREKGFDKEAQADILLIQAAEKDYRIDTGVFAPCANVNSCNQQLGLSLSNNGSWSYNISAGFCVDLTRRNHTRRDWHLQLNNNTTNSPQPCDCSGANC